MRPALGLVALAALARPAAGSSPPTSLLGAPAPAWDGVEWPAGTAARHPASLRGRVVVATFFTGDRDDGLEALSAAAKRVGGRGDVELVAIQWLGWRVAPVSTREEGAARLARAGLEVPHGTLLGRREAAHEAPFWRYAASALPWTVVADRAGHVRYEGPTRDAERLVAEVESLRVGPAAANPLVGRPFGSSPFAASAAGAAGAMRAADGVPVAFGSAAATLLRWWTNDCPHCTGSLPALARLEARHAARGLRVVGVYHPKGRRLSDEAAVAYARRLGHRGFVVFDDRWAKYLELRDRGGLTRATSVSVLVDRDGVIRWVHLGPRLMDAGDPGRDGTADFAELDGLLDRTLPR